jgi:adenine-specific DNA glycosylase
MLHGPCTALWQHRDGPGTGRPIVWGFQVTVLWYGAVMVCIAAHSETGLWAHAGTHAQLRTHPYTCMYTCTNIHSQTHSLSDTHTQTHTHTHTHLHTQRRKHTHTDNHKLSHTLCYIIKSNVNRLKCSSMMRGPLNASTQTQRFTHDSQTPGPFTGLHSLSVAVG